MNKVVILSYCSYTRSNMWNFEWGYIPSIVHLRHCLELNNVHYSYRHHLLWDLGFFFKFPKYILMELSHEGKTSAGPCHGGIQGWGTTFGCLTEKGLF